MTYLLGIDVGTTRTAAAISRTGGRAGEIEVVNLGDRSSAVPSVLFLGADGVVVVGDAAERRASTDPDHVVREFKRRIGDPTPLLVGGRPWAPEELSAVLVRWVADRVAQREGGGAARIAVTHPASWGSHKLDLLRAALGHHGLPVTFLAEPRAAALHYAATERLEPGSTIAVYDFGGGTFDAAVVHKDGHGFSLLGRPEGVDRLGGIDLDEIVFDHVRAGLPAAFDGLDDTDPAALAAVAAVRRECTEAKEALSADTEVSIPVLTPLGQGSVRLHRSEFEAMITPRIEETLAALRRAVGSAGLSPEQLSAVLLVGGSSRIPLVAQLVSEQLDRPVAVDTDPKNAIAMGAALSLTPTAPAATGPHVPAPRTGGSTGSTGSVGSTGGSASGATRYPLGTAATGTGPGAGYVPPAQRTGGMPPPRPQTSHPQTSHPQTSQSQPQSPHPQSSQSQSPQSPPPRPPLPSRSEQEGGGAGRGAPVGRAAAGGPGPNAPGEWAAAAGGRGPAVAGGWAAAGGRGPAAAGGRAGASGRSPGVLVAAGGAVAVVAVLATAFLWPRAATPVPAGVQAPAPTVATVAPSPTTTEPTLTPSSTVAPTRAPGTRTQRTPAPPVAPPVVTTTPRPIPPTAPTTTPPTPSTSTPPSTPPKTTTPSTPADPVPTSGAPVAP